jgi:hypothetical protein
VPLPVEEDSAVWGQHMSAASSARQGRCAGRELIQGGGQGMSRALLRWGQASTASRESASAALDEAGAARQWGGSSARLVGGPASTRRSVNNRAWQGWECQ